MKSAQELLEAIPEEAYVELSRNNPYAMFCIVMGIIFIILIIGLAGLLNHNFNKSLKEIRLAYKDAYSDRNKNKIRNKKIKK